MKIVTLLLSIILYAGTTNVSATVNDTVTINKLLKQCYNVRTYNLPQAKQIALSCLKLATQANYLNGIYQSNNILGIIYYDLGNSDTCFYYNFKALAIAKKTNPIQEVNSYINIANEYVKLFESDSAAFYCNKALSIKKGLTKTNQIQIKTCFFSIYRIQDKFAETDTLANQLLKDYQAVNNPILHARFLYSLLTYYFYTNNDNFDETFNNGVSQALLAKDSCILFSFYQTKALDLFYQSKFNLARKELQTSLRFFKRLGSPDHLSTSYFYLYMLERRAKKFGIAKSYLDSSYWINPKKSLGRTIKDDFVYNNSFADLYTDAGDYKQANAYLKKALAIQDSLQTKLYNKTTLEFQTKYQTQLKESKIQVQELQLSKHTQTRNFIILFFCTLIALGIFLYFKNKKTQQKNRANEQIKARKNILELQQQLLRTQMNPHFIFNAVDSIESLIYTNQNEQAIIYLNKFAKLTRQILENSTQAYIALAEEVAMLHNYLSIQQLLYNAKFSYTLTIDDTIDTELLLVPPMLTQPCIENAIKHGLKNKTENGIITIRFYMQHTALIFEVTDNGEGLSPNNNAQHKSLATTIVNQRLTNSTSNSDNKITTQNIIYNNIITGVITKFEIPYICEN